MYQAWLDQRWPNAGLRIGPRCQTEGIGITRPDGPPGLFTELFTVSYTVVTIGSAPCYGPSGSPSSSTGQDGGGGGCGGVLKRRKFSPGIPEVISKPLKDNTDGTRLVDNPVTA